MSPVPVASSSRRTTSRKSGPSLVIQPIEKHARSQNTAVPAKRRHGDSSDDAEKENGGASGNSDRENDGPYCYCGEGAWGAVRPSLYIDSFQSTAETRVMLTIWLL